MVGNMLVIRDLKSDVMRKTHTRDSQDHRNLAGSLLQKY